MKREKSQKPVRRSSMVRGFVLGVLTAVLVLGVGIPVFAAGSGGMKTISAWVGGVTIYVDKRLRVPTDANGKAVDPIIIDGTTYLPLRAVANMLGKEVNWNQSTRSVYIGEQPGRGETGVPAENLKKFSGVAEVVSGTKAQYKILGDTFTPFNAIKRDNGSSDNLITWKLDSKYKYIDGNYIITYSDLGSSASYRLSFYSVDPYGSEKLLRSYTAKCGDSAIDVHVDVSNCNFVRLKLDKVGGGGYEYIVLYDLTATTAG